MRSTLLALALVAAGLLALFLGGLAAGHSGAYLLSPLATSEVVVDGNITAAEWSDAENVDLGAIPGNTLPVHLRVKHNETFLYVAFDVVGDTWPDRGDFAVLAFDTGHDGERTVGGEDIFHQSGHVSGNQSHLVWNGEYWETHDSPYDPSLPDHLGLVSALGFGPSDRSPEDHRRFEFQLPLALLGARPGDTLGLIALVGDADTYRVSYWPQLLSYPAPHEHGDLVLDRTPDAVDVRLLPPSQERVARAGENATYALQVENRGNAEDTFEFSQTPPWNVTWWDADGEPLPDTDGDHLPEAGPVPAGSGVRVTARVEVPGTATTGTETVVTATSSADATVSATALLVTRLPPILLAPPHSDAGVDTDGDALFDQLLVQANLTVVEAGEYTVFGILYTGSANRTISSAYRRVQVSSGPANVTLAFRGREVFLSGADGPYAVLLRAFNGSAAAVDEGWHTTAAYRHRDFEPPSAYFAASHNDTGWDQDGDGLFDALVVNATLQVEDPGEYQVEGSLRGREVGIIARASNWTSLEPGSRTVSLLFLGPRVNVSDADGPYRVAMSLILRSNFTYAVLDRDVHTTAAYGHTDFNGPPARLWAPHEDSGLDTDDDGRYNHLVVNASLLVTDAGTYRVEAVLRDAGVRLWTHTVNITTLELGRPTVPLWFDGVRINASRADGPYTVQMNLYNASTYEWYDGDFHTTAAYDSLDFEEPPARFAPPHQDRGEDTDGDGLFDHLVVDTRVQVDVADDYLVEGTLRAANDTVHLVASNYTRLETGPQTVSLRFQGTRLNASEADGPYTVDLYLTRTRDWLVLDNGTHTTAPYNHTDFDGPPARFARPHADHGVDTDGDGLHNYLVVDVTLAVESEGTYLVEAALFDASRRVFLWTHNLTALGPGEHGVPLWFQATRLNTSEADGPYTVELYLYDYDAFEFLDNDTHVTANYSHADFDGPPATFGTPHSDEGVDTDDDGRYNLLVVHVAVQVSEAGEYIVEAFLYDARFHTRLKVFETVHLEPGARTVDLRVDGAFLNASEADGPYYLDLHLWTGVRDEALDHDSYRTEAYSHDAFEEPPVLASGVATTPPAVDGVLAEGEWEEAVAADLAALSNNRLAGYLLVMHDEDFVYIAYDVTGDETEDLYDFASVGFDTGHDGETTDGAEDQFFQSGDWQGHLVYRADRGSWDEEDSPYDPSLPDHQGLASAIGFGSTSRSARDHRVYEFAVPLALLGATSGDVLGLMGGSFWFPGALDASTQNASWWPFGGREVFTLPTYGDLVLEPVDLTPPTLALLSPAAGAVLASDEVVVRWSATDPGSGLDRFELQMDGGEAIQLAATVTSYSYQGMADGSHTVTLAAVDRSGNRGSTQGVFRVDTQPPTVTLAAPADGSHLASRSVEIQWAAADTVSGLSRVEVTLDDGDPVRVDVAATSYTWQDLSEGRHVALVVAVDRAGHTRAASAAFFVDVTPPTVTLLAPDPDTVVTSSSMEVRWEAGDAQGIDHFEISVDDGSPVLLPASATSHVLSGLSDGAHRVEIRAVDRAGQATVASADFRVDTNVFSVTGPYGAAPLIGVGAAGAVAAVLVALLLLGRLPRRLRDLSLRPSSGESPSPGRRTAAKLRELERLRQEEILTEGEYETKREEFTSRR